MKDSVQIASILKYLDTVIDHGSRIDLKDGQIKVVAKNLELSADQLGELAKRADKRKITFGRSGAKVRMIIS